MIQVNNVTMSYGGEPVVDDVTLTLPDGGITALIGPNGAGKSTLLSGIGRLMDIDSGTIAIDGRQLAEWDSKELAKTLAILRQENHLSVRLTVAELVMLGRHPHCGGRHTEKDKEKVAAALESVNLMEYADRFCDQLSGGQRQRAFIAMTLAQEAQYLLLDEPLSSLDMRHSRDMMRHLSDLVAEHGISVVIVIHDVNTAAVYADRLVALKAGRVIADGTPQEVITPQVLEEIFDVEARVVSVDGIPISQPVP